MSWKAALLPALLSMAACSDSYQERWSNPLISAQQLGPENRVILTSTHRRFALYGDNRNEPGETNPTHRKLLQRIGQHDIDFVIHVGDMVRNVNAWPSYLAEVNEANLGVPIVPVRGNHDVTHGESPTQSYYSAVHGRFQLLFLDDNQGRVSERQLSWISEQVAGDAGKRTIVFAHKALYSGANGGVRPELIEQLEPILVRAQVPLVVAGHYHNYERLQASGITHLVSAGGGAKRTPLRNQINELQLHVDAFHYVIVEIGDTQLAIKAYDLENTVIDDFVVALH